MWFRRYPSEQTDPQTDRRTHRSTSQPRSTVPTGKVTMRYNVMMALTDTATVAPQMNTFEEMGQDVVKQSYCS